MLGKVKALLELGTIELLTVLSFLAIGFGFNYKVNFYHVLGVEWFIGVLPTNFILITTFKCILASVVGCIIGYFLAKKVPKNNIFLTIILPTILIAIILTITGIYLDWILALLGYRSIIFLFSIFFTIFFSYTTFVTIEFNKIEDQLKNKSNQIVRPFIWVFIVIYYFVIPAKIGEIEAKSILLTPDTSLSFVKLKDDLNGWYLIEFVGDKALIKKKGSEKVYKLVEYKDIDFYQAIAEF